MMFSAGNLVRFQASNFAQSILPAVCRIPFGRPIARGVLVKYNDHLILNMRK